MADLLDQAHMDAGLGLLRADTGLNVYPDPEGNTPKPEDLPDRYVRVYISIERPNDSPGNDLTGRSGTWVTYFYCHCIGPNEYSAAAIAMRVRTALLDQRPAVAGRSVGPIRQIAGNPPTRDETTGPQVMDLLQIYRMTTLPG